MRIDYFGVYFSDVNDKEKSALVRQAARPVATSWQRVVLTKAMIETLSIQELRDSYGDLKKRVDQLGRFL